MSSRESNSSLLLRAEARLQGAQERRIEDTMNGFPDIQMHFPGVGSISVETKAVAGWKASWTANTLGLRPKQKLFINTWNGPYALLLWVQDVGHWFGMLPPKIVVGSTIFPPENPLYTQRAAVDWLRSEAGRQMNGRLT